MSFLNQPLMRISLQVRHLWQALSSPQTRQSYRAAAAVTWRILRETGLLLWLLVCLVLVTFDWGIPAAIAAGRTSRSAVAQLGNLQTETLAADTKQALLTAGKAGLANTLVQARSQLGVASLPESATPAATVSPATAPTAVAESPATTEAAEEA